MSSYEPPKYPTLEETKSDSKLLRKLPSRWKNNVAVIACVGMLTFGMLSGCVFPRPGHGGAGGAPIYVTGPVGPEIPLIWSSIYDDLQVSVHHGGEGGAPIYLVHLTENEARAIILARFKQFGLDFFSTNHSGSAIAIENWNGNSIFMDYRESWHGLGLVFRSHDDSRDPFSMTVQEIREEFAKVTDLHIGVFNNGGRLLYSPENWWDIIDEYQSPEFSTEQLEEHREALRQNIINQADAFIIELRERGILRGPTS